MSATERASPDNSGPPPSLLLATTAAPTWASAATDPNPAPVFSVATSATANSTNTSLPGHTATAATADVALFSAALALAALLLLFTTRKLAVSLLAAYRSTGGDARAMLSSLAAFGGGSGGTGGGGGGGSGGGALGFVAVAFLASALQAFKAAVALFYGVAFWQEPRFRYFAVYFALHAPMLLLYFLYERLAVLLSSSPRPAQLAYGWTLRVLMLVYVGVVVVVTYYFMAYAANNAAGGYTSSPPQGWYLKVILYAADMAIGAVILAGTFHALVGIIAAQQRVAAASVSASGVTGGAGGGGGSPLYRVILGSDCLKFALVAAIEAYKLANASDPAGLVGGFAPARTGFQHLIDVVKITLMTVSLFAPVAIATRIASSVGTASVMSSSGAAWSVGSKPRASVDVQV